MNVHIPRRKLQRGKTSAREVLYELARCARHDPTDPQFCQCWPPESRHQNILEYLENIVYNGAFILLHKHTSKLGGARTMPNLYRVEGIPGLFRFERSPGEGADASTVGDPTKFESICVGMACLPNDAKPLPELKAIMAALDTPDRPLPNYEPDLIPQGTWEMRGRLVRDHVSGDRIWVQCIAYVTDIPLSNEQTMWLAWMLIARRLSATNTEEYKRLMRNLGLSA